MIASLLAAAVIGASPMQAPAGYVPAKRVAVTWYLPTGRAMFDGRMPFVGAAACDWSMPLGTVVLFADSRVVVCADRGMLGSSGHVDVFAPDRAFGADVARAYPGITTVSLFLP